MHLLMHNFVNDNLIADYFSGMSVKSGDIRNSQDWCLRPPPLRQAPTDIICQHSKCPLLSSCHFPQHIPPSCTDTNGLF